VLQYSVSVPATCSACVCVPKLCGLVKGMPFYRTVCKGEPACDAGPLLPTAPPPSFQQCAENSAGWHPLLTTPVDTPCCLPLQPPLLPSFFPHTAHQPDHRGRLSTPVPPQLSLRISSSSSCCFLFGRRRVPQQRAHSAAEQQQGGGDSQPTCGRLTAACACHGACVRGCRRSQHDCVVQLCSRALMCACVFFVPRRAASLSA
jgi:hypothetical protein